MERLCNVVDVSGVPGLPFEELYTLLDFDVDMKALAVDLQIRFEDGHLSVGSRWAIDAAALSRIEAVMFTHGA